MYKVQAIDEPFPKTIATFTLLILIEDNLLYVLHITYKFTISYITFTGDL